MVTTTARRAKVKGYAYSIVLDLPPIILLAVLAKFRGVAAPGGCLMLHGSGHTRMATMCVHRATVLPYML